MREFVTPDPSLIAIWGEDMTFLPKVGGSYEVQLLVSNNAPDPDVQPAPIMALMGCMDASNFTDQDAPRPVKGDKIEVDDTLFFIYQVRDQRSAGVANKNAFWLYLTQEEGD